MSNKAKKRKVSEEPVLQDYTVTSFSDLNPDGAAPPDTSLFEDIKNYQAEVSEITFNKTGDINLMSGPYPSDSSLDSICKPDSNAKQPKHRRLFQKQSKEESVNFDLCLKDSFSEHSIDEKVNKPLKKKRTTNVRQSLFDSDLDSNTPIQNSPFKKPLQRKSKIQKKANLFDSVLKDSQPNTPDESYNRESRKKSTSKFNGDISSNCSIYQQSPPQNVVTRMKKRLTTKKNDSNIFDKDFDSSQSDVSMTFRPLSLKRKTIQNHTNDSDMFDDLLDVTENQSLNKSPNISSLPGSIHLSNQPNDSNLKSFSLQYNADSSKSECHLHATSTDIQNNESLVLSISPGEVNLNTDCNKSINSEKNKETGDTCETHAVPKSEEAKDGISDGKPTKEYTGTTNKIQIDSAENLCGVPHGNSFDVEKALNETETEKISLEDKVDEIVSENKIGGGGVLEHDLENPEAQVEENMSSPTDEETLHQKTEDEEISELKTENEETLEQETQDEDTLDQESEDEETLEQESEGEDTLEHESEGEEVMVEESEAEETLKRDTLEQETEDTEALEDEPEVEETLQQGTEDELLNHSTQPEGEMEFETEENKISKENIENVGDDQNEVTNEVNIANSSIENYENGERKDKVVTDEILAKYTEIIENTRHSTHVSEIRESNFDESIHIKAYSLEYRSSLRRVGKISQLPVPTTKNDYSKITIDTPDASFKDMPSSTPKINKGKRVSFFVQEDFAKPNIIDNTNTNLDQIEQICLVQKDSDKVKDSTLTRRKSSLRYSKSMNDSRTVTVDNLRHSRQRRVSFKIGDPGSSSLTQSKLRNRKKSEHSKTNQSDTCYSSVSLESLVYVEGSGSSKLDSESDYIDIHPSRGKITSSSNGESFNDCRSGSDVDKSSSQAKRKTLHTYDSVSNEKSRISSENENTDALVQSEISKQSLCLNSNDSFGKGGEAVKSTVDDEYISNDNKEQDDNNEIESRGEYETTENESEQVQDEKSEMEDADEEESGREELSECEAEEEDLEVLEEEEDQESEGEQESIEQQESEEQESIEQQESEREEEEQSSIKEAQESEHQSIDSPGFDDSAVYKITSTHDEQDENVNPDIQMTGGFKVPKVSKKKKQVRSSSLFLENPLNVPSKSQLREILHKIPLSELKKKKRKTNQNCISREQMQQYEIEDGLLRNQQKQKTLKTNTFSAPSKLKRPKKWVTPKLYDFLISKLKPHHGIRSRVRAEELVISLCEQVDCMKKKKDLSREDVDKMKIELARLNIVKTHWDFFEFVNKYFDFYLKEKMYPSVPGRSCVFDFGPTNVMENILMET